MTRLLPILVLLFAMVVSINCDLFETDMPLPTLEDISEVKYAKCLAHVAKYNTDPTTCIKYKPRTEKEIKIFLSQFKTMRSFLIKLTSSKMSDCLNNHFNMHTRLLAQVYGPYSLGFRLNQLIQDWDKQSDSYRKEAFEALWNFEKGSLKETDPEIKKAYKYFFKSLKKVEKMTSAQVKKFKFIIPMEAQVNSHESKLVILAKLKAYVSQKIYVPLMISVDLKNVKTPEELKIVAEKLHKDYKAVRNEEYENLLKFIDCSVV